MELCGLSPRPFLCERRIGLRHAIKWPDWQRGNYPPRSDRMAGISPPPAAHPLCFIVSLSALLVACQAGLLHHEPAISSQNIIRHDQSVHAAPIHYAAPILHAGHEIHAAPAIHAAPIHVAAAIHAAPAHHEDHYVDEYAHPKYGYSYSVEDPHTGDHKSQHETRDGDVVKGEYSLLQPDGSFRKVTYTADHHNGAAVLKVPIAHIQTFPRRPNFCERAIAPRRAGAAPAAFGPRALIALAQVHWSVGITIGSERCILETLPYNGLMREPEGRRQYSIMKQRNLAVFGLVDILVEYTLTMIGFQGRIGELEVWKLHRQTLKVNRGQNPFQGHSNKPKYG
ncbi:Cuticle protein 19 [Eumeta japonica]|uniref:Cuticle protein 19 n=1 Tax=Eumeta variegata TaxID=151549 RepID=A0A4C1Z4I0_EUMVA|nr:Cuticle protein 19 [Eumeta japonica]